LENAQDFTRQRTEAENEPSFDDGYVDDGGFGGDDNGAPIDEDAFGSTSFMPLQNVVTTHHDALPEMLKDMRKARLSMGPDPDGADFEENNEMFSYFDKATIKNWMGPEMWKAKRITSNIFISNSR
jgi:hypothetical protein